MRSMSFDLFTWYGISVTMIACFSLVRVSMAALARIMKRPRPVLYACAIPRARRGIRRSGSLALHVLQDLNQARLGIFHHLDGGIDDLSEIVRRNVGRHADRDAA